MAKCCSMSALALLFTVTLTLAGQTNLANLGSWSGVIINSTCSVDEAFTESVKCTTANVPGAQLVFYDDTIRQIYNLDPPAAASLGDAVIVQGTLDGNTIRGASIKKGAHIVWTRRGPESSCFFGSRPVWPGTDPRNIERNKKDGPFVLSLCRLVPVLQRTAYPTASCQGAVRKTRDQAGGNQL